MESSLIARERALELGFDLVGFCRVQLPPHFQQYQDWIGKGFHGSMDYLRKHANLKHDPELLLPGAKSIIAVGLNYNQPNPPTPGYPRIARYALGRDYHKVLRGRLRKLQTWLEDQYPDSRQRICVDSAPIMERDFAQLAGLGWFGKNTMLINSRRGSWFFIGVLLTTVEFEPEEPAVGGCGSCRECIDACPTGAIVHQDDRWQVDARSCISYLTIEHRGEIDPNLMPKMGDWTFGCDVCQEVCPFNAPRDSQPERARETKVQDFLNKRSFPSLKELTILDSKDWDELTQGSAIRRTGPDGLSRNAEINMRNSGG